MISTLARFTLALLISASQAAGQVVTKSYDNGRTGANTSETVFTPQLVQYKGLKRLKSLRVDDDPRIEAQPLYVPHLQTLDGKIHNVVFVATMGNHVWAFDADAEEGKDLLWKTFLGTPFRPLETQKPGSHRSTTIDSWGINILWGILSTPVIDLDANRMCVVNWVVGPDGKPSLFLHQIGLKDGKEFGKAVPIRAALSDANGQQVNDAKGQPVILHPDQKQRAALLLVPLTGQHKTLYVATTGGENPGAPHGWIVAFDIDSFGQIAAWVSTPSSFGGGIWQGSQGPSADDEGNVYAMTANGGHITDDRGQARDFNGDTDFAEAFVKLKLTKPAPGKATLTLSDWFIPFRDSQRQHEGNYDYRDQDLGSAAPVLPTDSNLVIGAGKDGLLYVLDRRNLGKKVADLSALKSPPIYATYNGIGLPTSDDGVHHLLDFPLGDPSRYPNKTHHLHGSPAYWNGSNGPMVFTWGENESLRAWKIDLDSGVVTFVAKGAEVASAALAADPTSIGGMPGGMLTVSSNGKKPNTGVVWGLAPIDGDANHDVVEGIARAYDATALDSTPIDPRTPRLKLIWDSKRSGVTFDYSKFCTPVVADGKLLVPTYDGRVDVYTPNP
ncbi:MAG: hypothetical protein WBC04_21850 [Candidatus Acidiferrales bacterium]